MPKLFLPFSTTVYSFPPEKKIEREKYDMVVWTQDKESGKDPRNR